MHNIVVIMRRDCYMVVTFSACGEMPSFWQPSFPCWLRASWERVHSCSQTQTSVFPYGSYTTYGHLNIATENAPNYCQQLQIRRQATKTTETTRCATSIFSEMKCKTIIFRKKKLVYIMGACPFFARILCTHYEIKLCKAGLALKWASRNSTNVLYGSFTGPLFFTIFPLFFSFLKRNVPFPLLWYTSYISMLGARFLPGHISERAGTPSWHAGPFCFTMNWSHWVSNCHLQYNIVPFFKTLYKSVLLNFDRESMDFAKFYLAQCDIQNPNSREI